MSKVNSRVLDISLLASLGYFLFVLPRKGKAILRFPSVGWPCILKTIQESVVQVTSLFHLVLGQGGLPSFSPQVWGKGPMSHLV